MTRIFARAGRRAAAAMAAAALTVLIAGSTGAAAAKETPQGVVEQFHEILLGVMKDANRLGYRGRFAALSPGVAQTFHLPVMARVVAGRYWKTFTREQKEALVAAFGRMTTATYAHRFDGYDGEHFQTTGEVTVKPETVLVKTQLVKSDGEPVELDYLLRHFNSGWRVIDIYLDGSFSELATRRSEYGSVLSRHGFGALIATIDQRVASYENGTTVR